MYCRNCGQKLADGDKFCSACGERTIFASESDKTEEVVASAASEPLEKQAEEQLEKKAPLFEPFDFKSLDLGLDMNLGKEISAQADEGAKNPVPPVEDFDWNIHTFPGMRVEKTEDIDFNWSMSDERSGGAMKAGPLKTEPEPDAEPGFAGSEQPEVFTPTDPGWAQSDIPVESEPSPQPETPETVEAKPSTLEEELFGGLDNKADEARKQSEQIDKFFTFNKKNEEFQKLLDQEYEKIKSGNILSEEMNTAAAATEEKFASRQPEDPMEELFATEGVVKGYEPKPVETDVLERIEAAEAEKKAREEAAKVMEEEKARAKAEAEAKAKAEAETLATAQAAEEAARLRLDDEAKRAADAKAAQEAAEREKARAAAREEAEAAMKAAEEKAELARKEAETKLAREAAEAEARAKEEAAAGAKAEAEEKARVEAVARAEAEARAKEEAAAKKAEEAKSAKEADPLNHISEMVQARETFFGQQSLEDSDLDNADTQAAEKTKAVDKAAILAGMATASEMVQRDRAAAAAAAANAPQEEQIPPWEVPEEKSIDLPDFLGHPEEEGPGPELSESSPEPVDLFDELQEIPTDDVITDDLPRTAEELDEIPADLFTIDDLIDESIPAAETREADVLEAAPVSDETMVMTEESVADILNGQTQSEEEKPLDETMIFPADFNPAADISESSESTEEKAVSPIAAFGEEEEEEEEEKEGKGRIVLKVFLVILIILLVMEIAGVVIKMAAPNSGAAKFIDSQLNKVIHLFTGDDAEYSVIAATEAIRTETLEDKTSLIKEEMGKNKDGNIENVKYNADLKFDPDKEYENRDLSLTQSLTDVTWYKDAENKQVYYDQAIVGAVIAYDSQKVNLINNNDPSVLNLMKEGTDLYKEVKKLGKKGEKETFKTLEIGEIRQAGSSYYVWVSEKVAKGQGGAQNTSATKKIYEMQPDIETMKVVSSYAL